MGMLNYQQLLEESGGGIELLPDGDYDSVIDTAKHRATSRGDKIMFVCKFRVITGPYANKPFWNNFVVSPDSAGALGFFFQHMAALGLPREFFAANPSEDQIAQALVGRQGRVTLGHDTVKGDVRNQVTGVKPAIPGATSAGVPAQPMVPPAAPMPAGVPAAAAAPVAPPVAPIAPVPIAPAPLAAPVPPVAPAPVPPAAPAPLPVAPAAPLPVAPAPVAPLPVPPPAVPFPVAPPAAPAAPAAPPLPVAPVAPAPAAPVATQPENAAPGAPPSVPI